MSCSKLSNVDPLGPGVMGLSEVFDFSNPLCDVKEMIDAVASILYDKILDALDIKKKAIVKISTFVSLASSLVSFVTSLITAVKTTTTGYLRVALYAAPVASLVGVIASISNILAGLSTRVKFDAQAAYNTVSSITAELSEAATRPVVNAISAGDYLQYGISFIGMVLAAGLTAFGFSVKDVNAWLSLREHTGRMTKDITGFITDMVEKVFDVDLTKNAVLADKMHKLAIEMEEMLKTPPANFILERAMYDRLNTCIIDLREVICDTNKQSNSSNRYRNMKSMFSNGYLKLMDIQKTIKGVVDSTLRPTAVGVVFQGDPGVGKSEYAQYILREVAKHMRYSPRIYNIKPGPSGNYYEIYSGEQLGIYNEFCATRQEASGIQKMNEVLSSDPCNLEAADLGYKHQPCKLTLVAFTANKPPNSYYDFRLQLTEDANMALMTRFLRIQVSDPQFEGRDAPNIHRTPTFTHLKIEGITPIKTARERTKLCDYADNTLVPMTTDHLIHSLVLKCAANEMHYIRKINDRMPDLPDDIRAGLEKRVAQLTAIQMYNGPPPQLSETRSKKTLPYIVRIQGPYATGKTQKVEEISQNLSNSLEIPIYHVRNFSSNPDTEPGIFILDDVPAHMYETQNYTQWINQVHYKSVVIIATNHVIPIKKVPLFSYRRFLASFLHSYVSPKSFFTLLFYTKFIEHFLAYEESYYDFGPKHTDLDGYVRRLGISGLSKTTDYCNVPCESVCITTTNSPEIYVNLESHEVCAYQNMIYNKYFDHLRSSEDISVVYAEPPPCSVDVTIDIRNFESYAQQVTSFQGCMNMFVDPNNPGAKVTVSKHMQEFVLKNSNMRSWIMPSQPTPQNFLDSVMPNLKRLNVLCPGIVVKLTNSGQTFLFKDRILYSTVQFNTGAKVEGGILFVGTKPIQPSAISMYYVGGVNVMDDLALAGYTGTSLIMAKSYISQHMDDPELAIYVEAIRAQEEIFHRGEQLRKVHPLLEFVRTPSLGRSLMASLCGALGLIATTMGVYKLAKKLFSDEEHPRNQTNSNTNSVDAEEQERYNEEYVDYVMAGKGRNEKTFIAWKIQNGERAERMSDWQYNRARDYACNNYNKAQTNATLSQIDLFRKAMGDKFTPEEKLNFEKLVRKIPIDAEPHNIHYDDVITKESTVISHLREKLEKNTLLVKAPTGMNYGILTNGKYFITVAHAADFDQEITVMWSPEASQPSKTYTAEIVARAPERDLMICQIKDKDFPPARDIRNDFVSVLERADWSGRAIYMRTIPGGETFFGSGSYLGKRTVPLSASNNPTWAPDDYITFNTFAMENAFGVHRRGDCGLPLVCVNRNKAFIVGIHNSVTFSGGANFSPTFREDIHTVTTSTGIPNTSATSFTPKELEIPSMEGVVSIPDYTPMLAELRPTKIWENHPEINVVGYCHPLRMYSKPAFHKKLVLDEKLNKMAPSTMPSPLTIEELSETARAFLPKDAKGKPSPLLAQTKKFFHPVKTNLDKEAYAIATDMHNQLLKTYIGDIRLLRNHEMINGIAEGNLKPVDLATSAGPFFKAVHKITNKKPLFVNHNQDQPNKPQVLGFSRNEFGEALAHQVAGIQETWALGKATNIFIKDNPKVELLPIADVENEGKLRLFCELDIAVNLVIRQILGDYISKSHQFHHELPSRLGFNPYTFPQTYMTQFGSDREPIGTDIKRLDKNYPRFIMEDFFAAMFLLAKSPKHKIMLIGAAKSIVRTIHMQDGVLYIVEGGNPSGIAATTPLNCFLGDRAAIYVYVRFHMTSGLRDHLCFSVFIVVMGLATYGDDQCWLIKKGCGITIVHIIEGYKELGLEIVPSKNFKQGSIEFCSRQIVFDSRHCVWISRLKQDSIIGALYWLDIAHRENIPMQLGMVMFEASLWDEDFFNLVVSEVLVQIKQLNLNRLDFKFYSWERQRKHFASYVRGEVRCPIVTEIGTDEIDLSPYEQQHLQAKLYTMPEYVIAYYDKCKQLGITGEVERTHSQGTMLVGDSRVTFWRVNLNHRDHTGYGEDPDLSQAVRLAYEDLYLNRFGERIDENAVFPTATSTSVSLRYTHATSPDNSSTYWSLYADDELIADGEDDPYDPLQASLTSTLKNVMSNSRAVSYLHHKAVTFNSDRTENWEHEHQCKKCRRYYRHTHHYMYRDHKQRPGQCPNDACEWSATQNERNRTKAHLLEGEVHGQRWMDPAIARLKRLTARGSRDVIDSM